MSCDVYTSVCCFSNPILLASGDKDADALCKVNGQSVKITRHDRRAFGIALAIAEASLCFVNLLCCDLYMCA